MQKKTVINRIWQFWNSQEMAENDPELIGCYPIGNGGLVEVRYRGYFETRQLKKIIHFTHKMNVLELGCGNGRWAVALAPRVNHYTAVDFSRPALDVAQKNIHTAKLDNVDLHERSIVEFESDRPFDVIYFGGVTQYLSDEDIHKTLNHLKSCIKPTTVIVDRSTINYRCREINEEGQYFSIYRTPQEIENIFLEHGFRKTYQKRSYRFMRHGFIEWLTRMLPYRLRKLPQLVQLTRPISYYVLLGLTMLEDALIPRPWHGGDRSHDFFVFKQKK